MKYMMPGGSITIELVISFLIFLFVFGWIGLQRGSKREAIVFFVATISWLVLQEKGDIFVRIANLGGKLMALISAGGLSAEAAADPLAAIGESQPLVTDSYQAGFLFLIWIGVMIVTYVFTNNLIKDKNSQANGWAILWGIANGLFFASIFLPRLALLFVQKPVNPNNMSTAPIVTDGRGSIATFLSRGFALVSNAISNLWSMMGPVQPYVLIILLTLFLILAYSTIRGPKIGGWGWGNGKKKGSGGGQQAAK